MASATPALPTAGGTRPRNVVSLGLLLLACSGTMYFGALIAAYLHMRRLTATFPPRGIRIDQYLGNIMVITMLLGVVTVEWAAHALRDGERRQALAGLGVTLAFGLSVLNLLSYTAGRVGFDAASHPYGVVVTAMTMVLGILIGVGVAFVTLMLLRVAGHQVTAEDREPLRAVANYWHFTVVASLAVWYTVVVLK